MNPDTYRQLEKIFGQFNEAVITLYTSLMELYPPGKRQDLLEALGMTLKNTAEIYRYVSNRLFEAQDK
jgi:hypothetical protein